MPRTLPITRPLVYLALLLALVLSQLPAAAAPSHYFADPAFERQWERTDHYDVRGERGFYWGPAQWFNYYEFYRESPNGLRKVQYFDKARMEINDPQSGSVSNGLLVVELVSGQRKLGDSPFDNAQLNPAIISVAGDPWLSGYGIGAGYSSFQSVATLNNNGYRDPDRTGLGVGATIDAYGEIGSNPQLAAAYAAQTRIAAYYDATTGHNIPRVFWDFMQRQGPIKLGNEIRSGRLIDWLSAMGHPITDAYWVRTMVAGVERDVLIQLFERRSLTFTPANPAASQVEMGNVGQHYFMWRYPQLNRAWSESQTSDWIAFASTRHSEHLQLFKLDPLTGEQSPIIGSATEAIPSSWLHPYGATLWNFAGFLLLQLRSQSDQSVNILGVHVAPNEGSWNGYGAGLPAAPSNYRPASSPDGDKIAYVSDRSGRRQLYLTLAFGYAIDPGALDVALTSGECNHDAPSWSPDGRSLVWMADCGGHNEIYKGELAYDHDSPDSSTPLLRARLVNIVTLTPGAGANMYPRYSPDGAQIAFQSDRDGNMEIYTMFADGNGQTRLTNNPAVDETPTWAQGGLVLAFASDRDGDFEIYSLGLDSANLKQLTQNASVDRWPVWFR